MNEKSFQIPYCIRQCRPYSIFNREHLFKKYTFIAEYFTLISGKKEDKWLGIL